MFFRGCWLQTQPTWLIFANGKLCVWGINEPFFNGLGSSVARAKNKSSQGTGLWGGARGLNHFPEPEQGVWVYWVCEAEESKSQRWLILVPQQGFSPEGLASLCPMLGNSSSQKPVSWEGKAKLWCFRWSDEVSVSLFTWVYPPVGMDNSWVCANSSMSSCESPTVFYWVVWESWSWLSLGKILFIMYFFWLWTNILNRLVQNFHPVVNYLNPEPELASCRRPWFGKGPSE